MISIVHFNGSEHWVIILFGTLYIIGVQGITMLVHLPLNNSLQGVDINELDLESLKQLRSEFETRWNYFNNIRTSIACAVSIALMISLGLSLQACEGRIRKLMN